MGAGGCTQAVVSVSQGAVACHNVQTGEPVWVRALPGDNQWPRMLLVTAGDSLVVTTHNDSLVGFYLTTGTPVWQSQRLDGQESSVTHPRRLTCLVDVTRSRAGDVPADPPTRFDFGTLPSKRVRRLPSKVKPDREALIATGCAGGAVRLWRASTEGLEPCSEVAAPGLAVPDELDLATDAAGVDAKQPWQPQQATTRVPCVTQSLPQRSVGATPGMGPWSHGMSVTQLHVVEQQPGDRRKRKTRALLTGLVSGYASGEVAGWSTVRA